MRPFSPYRFYDDYSRKFANAAAAAAIRQAAAVSVRHPAKLADESFDKQVNRARGPVYFPAVYSKGNRR